MKRVIRMGTCKKIFFKEDQLTWYTYLRILEESQISWRKISIQKAEFFQRITCSFKIEIFSEKFNLLSNFIFLSHDAKIDPLSKNNFTSAYWDNFFLNLWTTKIFSYFFGYNFYIFINTRSFNCYSSERTNF